MHDLSVLAIIWVCVFFASYLAQKTRMTPVLWYLFFGSLLVNTKILPTHMPPFIESFSELGIIIIMFALGFEEDTQKFLKSIKRSWGIAFFGAVAPFGITYIIAIYFWNDQNIALLSALAMTATAVSLTMVSLKSEGLSHVPAATGIMTSAVLDDIASLALVAVLIPLTTGKAAVSVMGIITIMGKAGLFFIIVTIIGAWVFPNKEGLSSKLPIIKWIHLKKILSMGNGEYAILGLLVIAIVVGLLAQVFGFHPAIGAYMAGLVIHQDCFHYHPERNVDFYKRARIMIDNVAFTWIGPVFFVGLGSKLIFHKDLFIQVLPESILLFIALFIFQIASAGLAAYYTASFSKVDSLLIGLGMLGRAELAFVVMEIAFVQNKIMTMEVFYTLMLTMFFLNVSVPLTIRWWRSKYYLLSQ
jgi:Kef-type K+ transport system membrane component KefB